jgi:hypothetical protein
MDLMMSEINMQLSKNKMKNFEDLFNLEMAHNEYLFFKIEKYDNSTLLNDPIKTFLVPANNDFVEIIDTQVKFNSQYTYIVKAYSLIAGCNYKFVNVSTIPDMTTGITTDFYDVEITPDFIIKETVLLQKTISEPHPVPLRPYVSFHNQSNSKNEIKIFLSVQKGSMREKFTAIENDDSNQFLDVESPDGMYDFSYSEEPGNFQIFRIDRQPNSYSDFTGELIGEFLNNYNMQNMLVTDFVRPNKKYYYVFRTMNESGHFSNPTAIYEVQLLKDSDESKVVVNILNLENLKPKDKQRTINFRNLLQIEPASTQTEINTVPFLASTGQTGLEGPFLDAVVDAAANTYANNVNLIEIGTAQHKIWGRKFKLRVKSNDTGKVIDFNINFNLIKNKSEADF